MWNNFSKQIHSVYRILSTTLILVLILTLVPSVRVYAEITPEEGTAEVVVEPDTIIDTGDAVAVTEVGNAENTNTIDTEDKETEEGQDEENGEIQEEQSEDIEKDSDEPLNSTEGGGEQNVESQETKDSTEPPDENKESLSIDEDNSDNETDTTPEDTEKTTNVTTPAETPIIPEDTVETNPENIPNTIINLDNEATSTTSATTSANTGENVAESGDSSAIQTGDAYAYSNTINAVNTNIIDSNGFIAFLNMIFGEGDVDLRALFDTFEEDEGSSCDFEGCESQQLKTNISNDTVIENNINVTANTGENNASGSEAVVLTGDAYAMANVTNIANTNIIDANYLVLTFSNFGDLFGNIVLPGSYLLNRLFQNTGVSAPLSVDIDNSANIENNVDTSSNTGENTASSESGGTVVTGDATSYSNVYNQANINVINTDSFTMLFRIHGDWDGEINGLPDGLFWNYTPNGIVISNTAGENTSSYNGVVADISNTADITNNVSASASTGNNTTEGSDLSYIETGDAYAATNVTNIVNTNVIGRNWGLLIFDIFGNWQGDLSFGQPDLWIGGTANVTGTTGPGEEIIYTFTITNLGDADATGVELNGSLNDNAIKLDEPMQNIPLGTIKPGETIELNFTAHVADPLAIGLYPVGLTAKLTSETQDENSYNNEEIVTVIAERSIRSTHNNGFKADDITQRADLNITKSANLSTISPGDTVEYEISVINSGGEVYDGILYDTIYDEKGNVILDTNWSLDTIESNETITVTYEVEFESDTNPGIYTNSAQILGYHRNKIKEFMVEYDSNIASFPITITGPEPKVLGINTDYVCEPYITSYLREDKENDLEQVIRLQTFLNTFTEHNVSTTGIFDDETNLAVQSFQANHHDTVLDPWGIESPTGYVYYTTQKRINEIYCDNTVVFPLDIYQTTEINNYKLTGIQTVSVRETISAPIPKPKTETVTIPTISTEAIPKEIEPIITRELPEVNVAKESEDLSSPINNNRDNLFKNFRKWINSRWRKIRIW